MKDEIAAFLQVIFEHDEGIVCLSTKGPNTGPWRDHFFSWPADRDDIARFAAQKGVEEDVYFCPNILGSKRCRKSNVIGCSSIWADVDECDPKDFTLAPSIVIETSPDKTQAYWLLEEQTDPEKAEAIAKSIAYENTTDQNGWNLARRLRVPNTYNHKYDKPKRVSIADFNGERYSIEKLSSTYYIDVNSYSGTDTPKPELEDLEPAEEILERNKVTLNPRVFDSFHNPPETKDWSSTLWELELLLIEAGFSDKEVFAVCRSAACNKYARDNRPESDLWNEIQKAKQRSKDDSPVDVISSAFVSPILTDEQRDEAANTYDMVQEYVDWARKQSDAAWQYHQAGIFTVLSTLLTGAVRLPMSFGTMRPNLWFMILGDTTLTRKSTAMDMATDMLEEVDQDALLATDGSIEGLLTQLSTRPGRPSLFLRDEITGLVDSVNKKEYYAGMLETFTKLYDGKRQRRMLRKEDIDIRDPNFIFFGGGIKSRMEELLTYNHVNSGFIPRFCFVSAKTDTTKLKPMGPPTEKDKTFYNKFVVRLIQLHKHYWHSRDEEGNRKIWEVQLTDDAWYYYNQFEYRMIEDVVESPQKDVYTPVMARLANSGLKVAMLLAAIDPGNTNGDVVVSTSHLFRAFYFIEQWREHAIDLISNIGSDEDEKRISQIMNMIYAKPGITKTELMRTSKFRPQQMEAVLETLRQREMIHTSKDNDGRLHARPLHD